MADQEKKNGTKVLVIVESPTKARTLRRFLGEDYLVESSVGHVRDLPANASEIPAKYKKEPWARLGVNVEDRFQPLYVVQPDKKKTIAELRKLLSQVDLVLLATDEDREGEAISWHLVEVLKPKVPVKRMVFHEITRAAVLRAIEETREIDVGLVDAQETRRIIDRLYGYEVSPILWKKVAPKLSAGRVQSVATRFLVERERDRMRFRTAGYWDLSASFITEDEQSFEARLHSLDERRIAGKKDFDPDTGKLKGKTKLHLQADEARALAGLLGTGSFSIQSAEEKSLSERAPPPFTTSTLQQDCNRKLKFDAKRTMKAAQRLYENGYITYMRTDSVALSQEALRITRAAIEEKYGAEYLPEKPRFYKTKVKNAQEAHEAIRPAGSRVRTVAEVRSKLGADEARVYELIWKRTLACQMADARVRKMLVRVAGSAGEHAAVFSASGKTIDFPGFLKAYVEGRDDPDAALSEREKILPPVAAGDPVRPDVVTPEEHVTAPPLRLTEATLIKALEKSGIGRPSTYASIIDTIQRREYAFKKGSALVPTFTAFAVVSLMEQHFADLINTDFTAHMEDRLDAISRGELEMLPYLREFYFGNDNPGLKPSLDKKIEDIDARAVCSIALGPDDEGRDLVLRVGRYGPFLQRGDDTAPLPDQTCPDELTVARASEIIEAGKQADEPIGEHPEGGEPIFLKTGRYGPYVQLGKVVPGSKKKPKMTSLLKGMAPEDVSLDIAVSLLSLPRTLGTDAEGVEVTANLGRYGPYVKRGSDSRSLTASDSVLTVDLPRALELIATKRSRKKSAGPEPLKVFADVEALGGVEVRLLDGRYGPYLTDGKVNASLPRDFGDPLTLTESQVVEFIEKKRAAKKKPRSRKK